MANWFKIYETDLDESRLKYALDKLPEVGWVWIGILSECCKHRSDTIRWSDKAHELFGFSDRLKVSIPKINEAISLLCEIEYITNVSGSIKVLRWNEKQSEYCTRKGRGDYTKSPIVSDNIRKAQSLSSPVLSSPMSPSSDRPSLSEVLDVANIIGLAAWKAKDWFDEMQSCGWIDWNHRPVVDYRSSLSRVRTKWEADGRPMSPPKAKSSHQKPTLHQNIL